MRTGWIVFAVVLVTTSAWAQTPEDDDAAYKQAQEYFKSGKRAFDAEEYLVAIESFEQAYRLTPKPAAAYALALAYRNQWSKDHDATKLKRAVILFREVLAQPDDPKKPKWDKTEGYLRALEPVLEDLEAKQAAEGGGPVGEARAEVKTALILSSKIPGTMVRFDDEPAVPAPLVKETTPGPHRVASYADGYYTTSQEVIAYEGESLPVDLILDERPAALTVHSADNARVVVDGLVMGGANTELSVPAGTHRVEVIAPGRHGWAQQLRFGRGETIELDAPLTLTRKRRAVKYVLAAGGALLLGGGVSVAFALAAQREAERIEDAIDAGEPVGAGVIGAHNDAIDRRDDWRTAAAWLFGGGVAAALATLYLFVTDEPPTLTSAAGLAVVPGGATASYAWAF